DGRPAVPVGKAASRLLDDHSQRCHIPRVNAMFDHHFARPLGDEQVAVVVTVTALLLCSGNEFEEGILLAGFDEPSEAGVEQHRIFEAVDGGDPNRLVISVGAGSAKSTV